MIGFIIGKKPAFCFFPQKEIQDAGSRGVVGGSKRGGTRLVGLFILGQAQPDPQTRRSLGPTNPLSHHDDHAVAVEGISGRRDEKPWQLVSPRYKVASLEYMHPYNSIGVRIWHTRLSMLKSRNRVLYSACASGYVSGCIMAVSERKVSRTGHTAACNLFLFFSHTTTFLYSESIISSFLVSLPNRNEQKGWRLPWNSHKIPNFNFLQGGLCAHLPSIPVQAS